MAKSSLAMNYERDVTCDVAFSQYLKEKEKDHVSISLPVLMLQHAYSFLL